MPKAYHRSFFLDGPAGKLEALLWTTPQRDPACVALVCHPHPLYGGTLHNKVVFHTARTLHRLGLPVLRFNFRGVGLSEGTHDAGRGEQDDVRAALDFLAAEFPAKPILLAGFSFGAGVGLRVGRADPRAKYLVGLGLPANNTDFSFLLDCPKPKFIIQGANDEHGCRANVEALFATLAEPASLVVIEGADHFFTGKLHDMTAALEVWAGAMLPT